jgi:enoyl-CoA hydratase
MPGKVLREDRQGVAVLALNRPEKLNSLDVELFEELSAHVRDIETDTETIGCVVLKGAGKCFSAGHDLQGIGAGEALPTPHFQARLIERMTKLPQPLIVAVHGHCYTGALELALAGDFILASANARFADTHAKWGMTPIWGLSQRLPRRVGVAMAHEMMMSCATYTGAEAASMGLANRCFPDATFEEDVMAFSRQILANSWFSLRENKRLVCETDGMPLQAGLAHEAYHSPGAGPDMAARIEGFQKRKS